MRIVALDASTELLSVAAGDGVTWHERRERAGNLASTRILGLVDAVLHEAGWQLRDLDGIVYGAGPGAFTGVRIACGVAQGLGFGANLPLYGVATLAAMAQTAWRTRGATRVVSCLDARMREVYVAAYEHDAAASAWRTLREPEVRKPGEVLPLDTGDWYGAGDGFLVYPELADLLRIVEVIPAIAPDARAIGELALPRLAAGEGVAAAEARPLYVRHRIALTTAERDAGVRL
jgi:tRNA threonylcarbamoyladenosine biosynthesis protein TsaB